MAALDIAMLGPAKPAIQHTFSIDERSGSWILNAFVLFNLMGVPVMSKMADLFGRRLIFLNVIVLFAAGGLVVATSSSYAMLLVGRSLQGLSVSGIFPVAAAVVGDVYEPEHRGRALGILGAVFGLAFIVGPIIAGLLLPFGWRWIYFAYLPLATVVWVWAFKRLPQVTRSRPAPLDVQGVITLSVALLSITYGISQLDPSQIVESLASPGVWPAFLIAVVLFLAFVRAENRAADPILRLGIFRNRQIALSGLIAIGAGIVEAAFISFPTLASLSLGVSPSEAAYMLVPLALAIAIGSPLAGRLLDRVGSRTIILWSNAALVMGMAGIAAWPASFTAFYTSTVLIGLGMAGIMGSALSYILLHESSEKERTASQGIITLFISIGQLFGAALVGSIVTSLGAEVSGYSTAFFGVAAMMAVLLLMSLRLKSRKEESLTVPAAFHSG